MNLIKEEVLEKLAEAGYHPQENNSTSFSYGRGGLIYRAYFGPDCRKYTILQFERNHSSTGVCVNCECLWTNKERRCGDRWIAEEDFINDGWMYYNIYGRPTGYRFPGYTGQYHEVNWDWGFAKLWNLLVKKGERAVREYKAKQALEEKIAESKRLLQKRNADPSWKQLKETTQNLIQKGKEGKDEARKLIKDYLVKEKQNQR